MALVTLENWTWYPVDFANWLFLLKGTPPQNKILQKHYDFSYSIFIFTKEAFYVFPLFTI